jgi:hypothetical protein
MNYKVESIGSEFSNKGIKELEKTLDTQAKMGYKFHSVFQVSQPGCMGVGKGTITYLAVYVSDED